MTDIVEVRVPDIGDFSDVPVIEILISPGEVLKAEDPMITLESDKATMDVPAPMDGEVVEIKVNVGDSVAEGDVILSMKTVESASSQKPVEDTPKAPAPAEAPVASKDTGGDYDADVVVLGAGPGGYTAAFRAADLGQSVILIERYPDLGGVCLNVGCIPSKALLHAAKVIEEADDAKNFGLSFGDPKIDIDQLRSWKSGVVSSLTGGLAGLAKQRKVEVVTGWGQFTSPHAIQVETDDGQREIRFKHAIIAVGSASIKIPGFPYDDPRLIDSTGALELDSIPERLLVIGGGIIGLEMATVYHALGSKISVVEMASHLIPGADPDLVRPLQRRIQGMYENIWLDSRVTAIKAEKNGLLVSFGGAKAPDEDRFDKVLLAVGRSPNGKHIDAEKAGVIVDERGFIAVDQQQRTNVDHIFAIGDVVGQPMLAHKATHEAKVAAEVAAGEKSGFEASVIPSVAYTDPEIAWVGLTETEAKAQGIKVGKGIFPWVASGRSLSLNRKEGMTKALFDPDTKRILGCGIVGPSAGDLIAEAALAIEMGADAEDISLTIHPHPTLSETVAFAAEAFEGTITDLYLPKRK